MDIIRPFIGILKYFINFLKLFIMAKRTQESANLEKVSAQVTLALETPTTKEELFKVHKSELNAQGVVELSDENFRNFSADSARVYTFGGYSFVIDEKLTGFGSGKKTVYTGRLKAQDGSETTFSKVDITKLKALCGCEYKRYKVSYEDGWLVYDEKQIEVVADKKTELFRKDLGRVADSANKVGLVGFSYEDCEALVLAFAEAAKVYAKKVLFQHEAEKQRKEKESKEAAERKSNAKKAAGLSNEALLAELKKRGLI